MPDVSRRKLIAAAAAITAWPAKSYTRIIGANDRIQIAQLGCGHRASGHRAMLKLSAQTDPKFDVRSVCDLWSVNRERAAGEVQRLFGTRPKTFKYSEELLADPSLDAVMIGTGDHQHARILAEVVRAGKDCYCEKPMANTIEDAKLARDTVRAGKQIVQMGSQWLSCPYQQQVREIIRGGKLGKIVSISQSWNFNGPRWHVPNSADVAAIREQDTDWNRWLLGRPARPFDPRVYFEFRIFKDFSGGITDQWYSHGAGLAHFYLDTFVPDERFQTAAFSRGPTCARTPTRFNASRRLAPSKCSTPTAPRSAARMAITPSSAARKSGWQSNQIFNLKSGKVQPEAVTLPGQTEGASLDQSDNLKAHTGNWLECMRSRKTPSGHIETGFAHSVAVVMATRSFRESKKMFWDRKNEQIVDRAAAL